jgi:hypothetical protein
MVGIVLHVQSNKGLRHTVHDSHCKRSLSAHPKILHVEEQGDVAGGTKKPSHRSEFLSPADNLEHFLLDFALKRSVEFVPGRKGESRRYRWEA